MELINNSSSNIAIPVTLFVKSPKEAKKIIRLESYDATADNVRKLNKKMYQRKVQGY
jgi:hypothetical protein